MLKKYKIPIIMLCLLTILTSCSTNSTETVTTTQTNTTALEVETEPSTAEEYTPPASNPTEGGTLRLSMRIPHTLNPLLNEDATVDKILKLVFEPCVVLNDAQKPVPNLAQSFEISSDGLSCTIVLKDGLVWSDNTPIVAEDIVYSIETMQMASEDAIYKDMVANVSYAETIDDKTAVLYYNEPSLGSSYNLCFPIIPEHYYNVPENKNPDDPINMTPLGSGLYKFDDYENLKELNFSINNLSFREKPNISEINVIITSDKETDLHAFSKGIIDAVDCELNVWGKYRGTKDANIDEFVTSYYEFIGFNFDNPILQDKNMRKAIAYSIDVDEIISKVYLDHAVRAYSPINPTSWLFEPNTEQYNQDVAKANEILKSAGYVDTDKNGRLDKTVGDVTQDISFKIIVNAENDERIKIATILKENLLKIKIESQVVILPFEEYQTALETGDFDIFVGGFNMGNYPDLGFAFHSASFPENGGQNYFTYSDPNLDILLEQANHSVSEENVKNNIRDIQKNIAEELPCISIAFKKSSLLTDKTVLGVKNPMENSVYSNINQWYMGTP